jgi:SAM-dependent methyltransferase
VTIGSSKIPSAIVTLSFCLCFAVPIVSAFPTGTSSYDKDAPRYILRAPKEERGQSSAQEPALKRRISRARKKPVLRRPDVIYYPTPDETVTEMLRLANIRQGDVLYDLGSGDGRIPIMAAQLYGIRAVGIEIDPAMVAVAQERAQKANVTGLVSFINADLFRTNISAASIVTLYLSNKLNLLLRPKLLLELRPGTRILSHDFHMGDWAPEQTIRVPWQRNLYRTVYLWTVPERGKKRKSSENNRRMTLSFNSDL